MTDVQAVLEVNISEITAPYHDAAIKDRSMRSALTLYVQYRLGVIIPWEAQEQILSLYDALEMLGGGNDDG